MTTSNQRNPVNIKTVITRGMGVALIASALLLNQAHPASAAMLGSGAASGTEDQLDAGDPPVNGTIDPGVPAPTVGPLGVCARAKDNDYVDPVLGTDADSLSAKYTLNAGSGTFTTSTGSYSGPVTITIESTSTFYFGPQGTHFGPTAVFGANCGASNLGQLSPVPASITVSGGTTFSCTANGSFWREAGDVFGATVAFTTGACSTSTVDFRGVFQPPCGLPFADCIQGAYTQQ